MAPKPLRQVTRKSAAALPTTQTAKFLLKSAQEAAESCPQLAAVLGRRCLQAACGQHGALTRAEASSLCGHCGAPLPKLATDTAKVVELSASARRRQRRTALKARASKGQQAGTPLQYNRAALIIHCLLCGHDTVRPYYTLDAARAAVDGGGGSGAAG